MILKISKHTKHYPYLRTWLFSFQIWGAVIEEAIGNDDNLWVHGVVRTVVCRPYCE